MHAVPLLNPNRFTMAAYSMGPDFTVAPKLLLIFILRKSISHIGYKGLGLLLRSNGKVGGG